MTLLLVLVGLFSFRRCLYTAASLLSRPRPAAAVTDWPRVGIVLASRDQEAALDGCLTALAEIDYPRDRLRFLLVSDGSRDRTVDRMAAFAAREAHAQVLVIEDSVGKAEALNRALSALPDVELVAVYDTDLRPRPDSLRRMVGVMDARTAAAGGRREPANRGSGLVASYAALECDVHQFVTLAGMDRLGRNPPTTGGNCVYRRKAALDVGGFPPGALSEDTEVSLALAAAGWRTIFVEDAVATSLVADSLPQFMRQRLRWSSGLLSSAKRARGWHGIMVAAGYLDRLLLLCTLFAVALGGLHPAWLLLYAIPPLLTLITAEVRAGLATALPRSLLAVAILFPFDVGLSLWSALQKLAGRKPVWRPAKYRS
jgi:cellulose synthase/poly-beta-1,6-N-acetylglucosamine synthase-like glycosyltransferase